MVHKTHMKYYIGTSGWHYNDWLGRFYPPEITGYNELRFHAQHYDTVENNSSFYRISKESTYKTWDRMTPDTYRFSMKLNRIITHDNSLELTDEVRDRITYILDSTQILGGKLGAIVIQLPASFKYDLQRLESFLEYFVPEVRRRPHPFDIAIEFRNKFWFNDDTYALLRQHNVALVYGQSSRYPGAREVTADFVYIRMHGPGKLFASPYSTEQLAELAAYLQGLSPEVTRSYVYFNNDYEGFALDNATQLMELCDVTIADTTLFDAAALHKPQ